VNFTYILYVATCQQYLNVEYISISWSDIPDVVEGCCWKGGFGSYHVLIDGGLLLTRKLVNQWFLVIKLKWTLQKFQQKTPFVVITIWPFPHSWLITGFVTRVTRRSHIWNRNCFPVWIHTGFSRVGVARSLVFCAMFCSSLFIFFPFFLLAIALSVLLRFTVSDYSFSIFKLFFFPDIMSEEKS
jgi:hypothetical protein